MRPLERGRALAAVLTHSWRGQASPADDAAIEELTPLLLASGTAPLAWRRLRARGGSSLAHRQLRQAHRLHALQAALHDQALRNVLELMQGAGLEWLLAKGWAVARAYPRRGLRPYGDFDLFVAPEDHARGVVALAADPGRSWPIDLHAGARLLDDRSWSELRRRRRATDLGEHRVTTMGPEDHLRYVALHMLGHGAWRPLWLCDVAVLLESAPPEFDWDYALAGDSVRTRWFVCALRAAQELLSADLGRAPEVVRNERLPRWLLPTVLRQWGAGQVPHGNRVPMANVLKDRRGLGKAFLVRWPNAIEASVGVHAAFDDGPRWPVQIREYVQRGMAFARQPVPRAEAEREDP